MICLDSVFPFLDSVPVIRAILAVILVFFAPGLAWSLVLFRKMGKLERFVLSVGVSIAVVTLTVLALNYVFNVPINGVTALVTILVLIAVPLAIWYVRRVIEKRKSVEESKS